MAQVFPIFFPVFFRWAIFVALVWIAFSFASVSSIDFNATVCLDGNGDFTTIGSAILAAPSHSNYRFFIHVKPGTYRERVEIPKAKTFIALVGDNAFNTIIIDDRSSASGFKTFDSATLSVHGDNFMAQYLSFENSAGPEKGQAVAVLNQADHTSYYKCRFVGFQDTLYVNGQYQFFKECDVYGSVDFIFGHGLGLFQDSNIYARLPNHFSTVTAQSKDVPWMESGFSFHNCTVTASPEITSNRLNVHAYLGRPWREYSKVVFMESFLDTVVLPAGWLEWSGVPVSHLFYAEYNNRGPGADLSNRVNWTGFHVIGKQLALQFTVDKFIDASYWLPETGVPYRPGLLS